MPEASEIDEHWLKAGIAQLVAHPADRILPDTDLRAEIGLDSSGLMVLQLRIEEATGRPLHHRAGIRIAFFGADTAIRCTDCDHLDRFRAESGPGGFDCVIDMTFRATCADGGRYGTKHGEVVVVGSIADLVPGAPVLPFRARGLTGKVAVTVAA
jgi:acyl carrier protein